MSFFQSLVQQKGLPKHDGRPLWQYFLTERDFHELLDELKFVTKSNLDPRDATLFYAEWWNKNYTKRKGRI